MTAVPSDREAVCYEGEIANVLEETGFTVKIANEKQKSSEEELPAGLEMTIKENTVRPVHAYRIVRAFRNAGVAIAGMPMTTAALLDLDLAYGDAAVLLNLKPGSTLAALGAHGDGLLDEELLGLFTTEHPSGLALVQGCDRPERAARVTVPAVQRSIAQMRASYDQVLVDLPSNFSEPTLAAIGAADRACIVVPPSLPGLRASRHCLEVLEQISFPLEKIAIILNRARPGGLAFEEVSQFLNHPPDVVVVYSETLEDCAAHGVPVVTGQPNSVVAHEIRALADFLAGTPVPAHTA